MAGILKVDQVQSDSNLSFQVAGANVAYMNSTGLQMTGGTLSLGGTTIIPAVGQIAFPANQNASSDPNTLDDYEEGYWTPIVRFSAASVGQSYSNQFGRYIKIGNQVTIWWYIIFTNKGTSTGNATIYNVPFSSSNYGHGSLDLNSGFTSQTVTGGYAIIAGNEIYLRYNASTGYSDFNNTVFTNTSGLLGSLSYFVA